MGDDGRESLITLLNDLVMKFRAQSPSSILEEAERSIGVLEHQGFLYLIWQLGSDERSVLTTERKLVQFKDLFRWDDTSKQWELKPRERAFTDLILQLTQGGVEALDLISAQSSKPTPPWEPR
jgi:hypothetical protein